MKNQQQQNIPIDEDVINSFREENIFLSNIFRRKIFYKGIIYPTVEHAFQASKISSNDRDTLIKISKIEKPQDIKKEFNLVESDEWKVNQINIMYELLFIKFGTNNKDLKGKLLNTNDKTLIFNNRFHDNFWGSCNCQNCSKIDNGKNILGKLLMNIRTNLQYIDMLNHYSNN